LTLRNDFAAAFFTRERPDLLAFSGLPPGCLDGGGAGPRRAAICEGLLLLLLLPAFIPGPLPRRSRLVDRPLAILEGLDDRPLAILDGLDDRPLAILDGLDDRPLAILDGLDDRPLEGRPRPPPRTAEGSNDRLLFGGALLPFCMVRWG